MTMTQRGRLTESDWQQVQSWTQAANKARNLLADYRRAMVDIVERSSFREVSEVTGISTTTLQRWKREAGK